MEEHLKRYFVTTVVFFGEGSVGLIRAQKSHGSRQLDSECNLVSVSKSSALSSAPESVQVGSTHTCQHQQILLISRDRISAFELPKDAKVAFKWDQEVVAVSSHFVGLLVDSAFDLKKNVWVRSITASAPHLPTWFVIFQTPLEIGTKYAPGPFLM
jgi:hypothetical protein